MVIDTNFRASALDVSSTPASPLEDFMVLCPVILSGSRHISRSYSSPGICAPCFLQTPPPGNAHALLLSFAFTYTWTGTCTPSHDGIHGAHGRSKLRHYDVVCFTRLSDPPLLRIDETWKSLSPPERSPTFGRAHHRRPLPMNRPSQSRRRRGSSHLPQPWWSDTP